MQKLDELQNILQDERIVSNNTIIVCLGNELRSDDSVGIYIGSKLMVKLPNFAENIILAYNVPINFLGKIVKRNPTDLIFIDAVKANLELGTILFTHPNEIENTNALTTHYQEFEDLIDYLQTELSNLRNIWLIGIQIENTEFGMELSEIIKTQADKLVQVLHNVFTAIN